MDSIGTCGLVRANTSDLTSVGCISHTSFCERWSIQVKRVVTAGKNEVSNELLISVNDEISTERSGFFAVLDQFSRGEVQEVTPF